MWRKIDVSVEKTAGRTDCRRDARFGDGILWKRGGITTNPLTEMTEIVASAEGYITVSVGTTKTILSYMYLSDGTIEITNCDAPATGALEIPDEIDGDTISSIGDSCFSSCYGLTGVTIPDCITNIGSSAFLGCTSLETITIPDGVTSIENSTFSGCTSLTSVTIPDSVTSIGSSAFYNCTV